MVVPPHRDGGQAQYVELPVSTAAAQRLLETTDRDLETIARLCGFGNAATLRHHVTNGSAPRPPVTGGPSPAPRREPVKAQPRRQAAR